MSGFSRLTITLCSLAISKEPAGFAGSLLDNPLNVIIYRRVTSDSYESVLPVYLAVRCLKPAAAKSPV